MCDEFVSQVRLCLGCPPQLNEWCEAPWLVHGVDDLGLEGVCVVLCIAAAQALGVHEPVTIPAKVVCPAFFGGPFAGLAAPRVVVFGQAPAKRIVPVALCDVFALFLHGHLHELVAFVVGKVHASARVFVQAFDPVASAVVAVVGFGALAARVLAVFVVGHAVACPLLSHRCLLAACLRWPAVQGVVVAVGDLFPAYGVGLAAGPLQGSLAVGFAQLTCISAMI